MHSTAPRVALRCDASHAMGVGHVMRSLAIGEELSSRGYDVLHWGDLGGIDWLEATVDAHGWERAVAPRHAGEYPAAADGFGLDAVVLDGYDLDPTIGRALSAGSQRTLALVDYDFGVHQYADVYLDQNLGARPHPILPAASVALAGIDYALFRDVVLERRHEPRPGTSGVPTVAAFFGGTDPFGAAAVVLPALLATGLPLSLTAIAGTDDLAARIAALPTAPGQQIEVRAPSADIAGLLSEADLVISASGSSVWELLCIGTPTAVVCVADNQHEGYRLAVEAGVVAGLGMLSDFDAHAATTRFAQLLTDPDARVAMARSGQLLVDGRGRERVVDALVT